MGRGKYDSYFDDALGNFVTLRIANYIDAWWHDIMSCNMMLMHDMAQGESVNVTMIMKCIFLSNLQSKLQ